MSSDPNAITEAIERAEDAFEYAGLGRPDFEDGIDQEETWTTQLTKACRYLEAVRVLRSRDGFCGAVVELCFGAIERTLEGYVLWAAEDSLEDFMDHTTVYDRVIEVGLFDPATADSLRELYGTNRTAHYYGGRVPTGQKADAMARLAEEIHEYTVDQLRHAGVCRCPR